MSQSNYRNQSLVGATGVELIVALYDAALRFLYQAVESIQEGNVPARRHAVKRFVDIIMYLQARLRTDVGGETSETLSNFYATMFTQSLEASHAASIEQFNFVISNVRNVRDAWVIVARDPTAGRVLPRELRTREERFLPGGAAAQEDAAPAATRWSA